MEIEIRPFAAQDIPAVAALDRELFSLPWSERDYADLLTHDYCFTLVAYTLAASTAAVETDGRLAGFVSLQDLCGEASIDKVMTDPVCRRQGVAQALLEEAFRVGAQRGIMAYTLEVRVSNAPAIALYEKLGFVSEGVRPGFYEKPREDALILWKRNEKPAR